MKSATTIRLMIMMFLQFVVWGAWYGQLSKYLFAIGFDGAQVGNIYSTFSIAMIISPFIAGMIADRFFCGTESTGGFKHCRCRAIVFPYTYYRLFNVLYRDDSVLPHFRSYHRINQFHRYAADD